MYFQKQRSLFYVYYYSVMNIKKKIIIMMNIYYVYIHNIDGATSRKIHK